MTKMKRIHENNNKKPFAQTRIINLTSIKLTQEQTQALNVGPNFAMEQEPNKYINDLIIDTENAVRYVDPKLQNTYRHMTMKHIKQIKETNKHNTLHKRQLYIINKLRKMLQNNNITIAKTDESKVRVIIDKNDLIEKVHNFLRENNIRQINKDPTDRYQKQIQQAIQQCKLLIEKRTHTYLMNIKPRAPQLYAYLKTHKENAPIRSVINNTTPHHIK